MILAVDVCDLLLEEHNLEPCDHPDHRRAIADRLKQASPWHTIERTKDRDYLAGQPIHCGTTLELQELTYRSDDYGEYSVRLETGTRVRYELAWPTTDGPRKIVLYLNVGGHEFSTEAGRWMRFRWPVQR